MAVLNSSQRNTLEKAVLAARRASEQGAVNALKAFAVHHHEPYAHMSGEERALRNHLRSKARLLGDHTTKDGGHTIHKLAYELAYEYWHRMLFARFLEANDLLIHPEHEMPVSLEECEELGAEEGHEDKWVAAAYYASKMLPAIFRQDDPLVEIKFATEDRIKLEQILEGMEEEIYKADDSLGWVYQYWQSDEKQRINDEGNKIDGESLPAVTQLFTEPYMVHFLIDNTLGAWWSARNPGITPPIEFKYLRTLDDGTPAAGKFEGWPDEWKDITMMDPCMGSGHFVVEVFKVMAALRMQDEGLSHEEACDAVIRENIHGLELDDRCTQIAAFNLALTAWKFCGEYRELPEMNLACCGIAPKGKKEDWLKLANAETEPAVRARLKGGMERMYDLFQKAPELGSLIDPTTIQRDAFTSDFTELEPFLERALIAELKNDEDLDRGIVAAGIAKAGRLLAKRYVWQITNVPYLASQKQNDILYNFCTTYFNKSKNDLATVFLEKMLSKSLKGSTVSVVIPQNWTFLSSYKALREYLLKMFSWNLVSFLGPKAFSTPMWDFNVMLLNISNFPSSDSFRMSGIDVGGMNSINEKSFELQNGAIVEIKQSKQIDHPGFSISFEKISDAPPVKRNAYVGYGTKPGRTERVTKFFWEISNERINSNWQLMESTPEKNNILSGKQKICYSLKYVEEKGIDNFGVRGAYAWGKKGIIYSKMADLNFAIYCGKIYDDNTCTLIPKKKENLSPFFNWFNSGQFKVDVRKLNKKVSITKEVVSNCPFNISQYENTNLLLPKLLSNDSSQWLFHGHPKYTESPLQVTISRLLGYQWPAEQDEEMELAEEAREKIQAIHDLALPFDEDGIVCIPPVNGEPAAADRIREQIMKIWGEDYNGNTIKSLLQQEGSKKRDLESYLRDDFFTDHCKLFKNRPFIWHIWDGRKDGFSALVNYHKLDKANLEKLIYTYLGDWMRQCELKLQKGVSGADGLLSAAKQLKEKLLLILKGEPPYDLFIRWKPIEEQPIGWDPDINDGVRLNVYPFVEAGVLRKKFNVKWSKDRGKNPSGSHWGPERHNRYEDLDDQWKLKDEHKKVIPHLITEVKRKAREKS